MGLPAAVRATVAPLDPADAAEGDVTARRGATADAVEATADVDPLAVELEGADPRVGVPAARRGVRPPRRQGGAGGRGEGDEAPGRLSSAERRVGNGGVSTCRFRWS